MAVPTLTAVGPNTGPSLGGMLVTLTGTNFRAPTIAPGSPPPTVLVLFGGLPAADVRVLSASSLTCLVPRGRTDGASTSVVAVTVTNLDDDGVPISGESVTLASGYTYIVPTETSDAEGDLAYLIRTLIRALKVAFGNQVVDITYAVHTDYDPTTGDEFHVTKFAQLPGLSLVGPDLTENRFYSLNAEPEIEDPSPTDDDGAPINFVGTKVPYTVDVTFTLVGASNAKIEILNMMQNLVAFMHATKYLVMDRDRTDPSKGTVRYEMDFVSGQQPKSTTSPNASNIRSFSAQIVIRGFDIEALSGVAVGSTAGVPNHAITQKGKTLDELHLDPAVQTGVSSGPGPSPGP